MKADEVELRGLLDRWEAIWRRLDVTAVGLLRPGRSDAAMNSLVQPLGLRLPSEARVWWSWHDGVERERTRPVETKIAPATQLLSLAEALEHRAKMIKLADLMAADPQTVIPDMWPRTWIPIMEFDHGDYLVVDCGVDPGAVTPIRNVGWEDPDFKKPRHQSLAAMVEVALEWLDRGVWTWDGAANRWREDNDRYRECAAEGLIF